MSSLESEPVGTFVVVQLSRDRWEPMNFEPGRPAERVFNMTRPRTLGMLFILRCHRQDLARGGK